MTRCPSCQSPDVRIHGTVSELSWRPRFWFFGQPTIRLRVVAAECSCGKCFTTFTARQDGAVIPTENQAVHRIIKAAQETTQGKGRPENADGEAARAAPMPRPAPDPRSKRR